MLRILMALLAAASILHLSTNDAFAAVSDETAFVFNTFSFLVHGLLVMFMACGFAMLESGLVRAKNTSVFCLYYIALFSLSGFAF